MSSARYPLLFVTGTDTEVGKTLISCALLKAFQRQGVAADGFKPVASGAKLLDGLWCNEDGLALQAHSARQLPYDWVNPNVYQPAIAPHIAAKQSGRLLDTDSLNTQLARIRQDAPLVIVEGAGGWQVPLNDEVRFADWAAAQQWPVILVVGVRLGCINHALLSAESIIGAGCPLVGWVANHVTETNPVLEENVSYLRAHMPAPLLGQVGFQRDICPERIAEVFDLSELLNRG